MKYRAEIDGLRAVAVVPVVLFHAGLSNFAGGFVGVDVFFVISGYLITTILINDLDAGRFSLIDFYERRARRILPALVFVVLCCFPVAWALLAPRDMVDFGQSVLAVATFSSNILFWLESGYFDTAAELKPLLHTWSLAVEEQFYILFPLVLMLGWRRARRAVLWVLALGGLVSLALAHWGVFNAPGPTFYLLPTRGWELLMGSFAAIWLQRRTVPEAGMGYNLAALAGALMILVCVFVYDKATPFPGLYAVPPTLGTVLIILFARPGTWVHAALSWRPVVGVGLVSYSAYLWHQPLLVFYRHWRLEEPHGLHLLIIFVATGVLAWFSWRFIERPFRSRSAIARGPIFAMSIAALGGFAGVGAWVAQSGGVPDRYPQLAQMEFFRASWGQEASQFRCLLQGDRQTVHDPACFDARGDVVLWGDSHAGSLSIGLRQALTEQRRGFTQVTQSGCPPLFDLPVLHHRKTCNAVNEAVLTELENRPHQTLILHAAWLHPDYPLSEAEFAALAAKSLARIQARLPQARILVVGNVPRWGGDVERAILRQPLQPGPENRIFAPARTYPAVDEILARVTAELGLDYLSAVSLLCREDASGQVCAVGQGDAENVLRAVYYIDNGHMSRPGARLLARAILDRLSGAN